MYYYRPFGNKCPDIFWKRWKMKIFRNCRQQAKLFEDRMSSVFGGVENAPTADQINLTFQKMAGLYHNASYYIIIERMKNRT